MARILLIDDENNVRMMVKLALRHAGHTVGTAADGPDGLDKFKNGDDWDVVLLDQRMPGMTGLDVLREIRKRSPDAQVIMITAVGTIDLAVDAMKAGAQDFLRKPFTAETLRGSVQAVLDGIDWKPQAQGGAPSATSYSMTTINGYWIESQPGPGTKCGQDLSHTFTVISPTRERRECKVLLPGYVIELVRAHANRENLPGGVRFWQALCEEVLANYLWQNSEFPPDGTLRVDEYTSALRRWVESVCAIAA